MTALTLAIATEVQKLSLSAVVTLFSLDLSTLGGPVEYFHAGTNGLNTAVVWQGQTYTAFPITATGFEWSGRGQMPRPKLQVSNVFGTITALILQYGDLVGCTLRRKRTLAKFLDAVNFSGGNATADPTAAFPDDVYRLEQRTAENKFMVEYDCAAPFDFQGQKLPSRPIISNTCIWQYRSAECSYTGTSYFDVKDASVSDASADVCGKRLTSCKARFGASAPLPYGGFPGAGMTRTS